MRAIAISLSALALAAFGFTAAQARTHHPIVITHHHPHRQPHHPIVRVRHHPHM